nr:hypothetical protein [Tanacetum cinerariifolium]
RGCGRGVIVITIDDGWQIGVSIIDHHNPLHPLHSSPLLYGTQESKLFYLDIRIPYEIMIDDDFADQIAKDISLVALENHKAIGKCNLRIDPTMKRQKETTYQVVIFKIDNKMFGVTMEEFRDIPNICLRIEDIALVALENHKAIGKCNMRIDPTMKRQKKTRYQVVLDALAISTCYPAFIIMAEVPVIYMHQVWHTFSKHGSSYRFKINNKKFIMIVEEFRDILNIYLRIKGQEFLDPPYKEEAISFNRHLGHTVRSSTSLILQLITFHQPWRTFASIINKYLSSKDLDYQIENKDAKNLDKMYFPRFTKFIINHYLTRNSSISWRNRMFIHTTRDDPKLGILKFVSKYEDIQVYSALIPKEMTDADMLESESFKTYYAIPTAAEPINIKIKGSLNQNHLKKLQQESCENNNVKDDDDDSDENVDNDDEMIELDNDEEDINQDERIMTLEFHEEKDEEDYDDLFKILM